MELITEWFEEAITKAIVNTSSNDHESSGLDRLIWLRERVDNSTLIQPKEH